MQKNKMKKHFYKFVVLLAVACLFLPLGSSQAKKKSTAYVAEGTAFYAHSSQANGTSPVYRFFSKKTGDHFYALSSSTPKSYKSESIAFYAYSNQESGTLPVYRFFSKKSGDHFYLMSGSTPSTPKNYKSEGIAFYAYPGQESGTLPAYRFFGGRKGDHFYTISESEKDGLGASASSSTSTSGSLGPEISVGLWYNSKTDIFKIDANRAYRIKDKEGNVIAPEIAGDSMTRVKYDDNGKLKVWSSITETLVDDNVTFDAADGDNSSIIFDVHRGTAYVEVHKWDGYDHFRGKINVNYYHGEDIYNKSPNSVTQIWVINKLPLEQYVWGAGETRGTGDPDHVRVMATIFRTYGQWYIDNATKYMPMGFLIRSDSGSQIYVGSNREDTYPKVREAAEETRGRIVKYKGEVALTPYCSYTDGYTRPFDYTNRKKKPRKGYAYLKSVKDHKKGRIKGLKPGENGNHMWGLSAHGALGYAEDGKSWTWILQHYYTKVDISSEY